MISVGTNTGSVAISLSSGILETLPRLAASDSSDIDPGDVLTYWFEIDTSPMFDSEDLVASGPQPAGAALTAWQLRTPLMPGRNYYRRVWAGGGLHE